MRRMSGTPARSCSALRRERIPPVFALDPEPHPDLVAAQRVTSADVLEAALFIGLFPCESDRPHWPLLRDWVARGGM